MHLHSGEWLIVYYKIFPLTVRTIVTEYLVVMKLKSGRCYKNDLSDIVGIISEHSSCFKKG